MAGFGVSQRVLKLFAAQFEPDGSGYIYRKSTRGPAVRVSATERDAFVSRFRSASQWLTWGTVLGTMGLIAVLVAFDGDVGDGRDFATYGLTLVVIALFTCVFMWNWNAPARTLRARPETGQALSRQQASHAFIRRTSYVEFLGYAAISVMMFWNYAQSYDVTQGWARLAPFILVIVLGLFTWRMIQKWQLERNERDD